MDEREKIAQQMRADWDRRVAHDYRFWMSDGHKSDQAMFASGERDLAIILADLEVADQSTFLEIGCGVGRLLKAALPRFSKVIGFDVSDKAINKAKDLLPVGANLELRCSDGISLNPIADKSIDTIISYAALTSIPTDIMAGYFAEMNRTLKDSGTVRVQMYLGTQHLVGNNDTLHLRCYDADNFRVAMAAAGFDIEWIRELQLPFQVSFAELGIGAVIVSLKKNGRVAESREAISKLLLPDGEPQDWDEGKASEIESYMALTYAQDLVDQGELERARETLEMVATRTSSLAIDIRDLLDRIVSAVQKKGVEQSQTLCSQVEQIDTSAIRIKNNNTLRQAFPLISAAIENATQPNLSSITWQQTPDGAVMICDGQGLDHGEKPLSAATIWAKRLLAEKRFESAERIVVYGLSAAYHVRALLAATSKQVAVIEPRMDVFIAALNNIDLSDILPRLVALEVGPNATLSCITQNSELTVRPQAQVISADTCARVKASFYGKRGLMTLHPKITVLGPLQGGTLPITAYCSRSLAALGQRVRELDMSGFASSFHYLGNFTADRMRLATSQGHYIEMLSQVVLDTMSEKPGDILLCMAQAPISGRVLNELRKRGVITVLWFVEDYERFTYWQNTAQYFDFVFTIQKGECIEKIKAAGAGEVHYLPTACDPFVHRPLQLSAEERQRWGSPYSFVGAGYHNRQQVFASFAEMPFKIWGTEWPTCRPFDKLVQEQGRRLTPDEYIKIFNATDININLHSSTERDGVEPYGDFVNPRTFELAASGAFQLVDSRSLLAELFVPGKEIVTFDTIPELREKMAYYAARPEERAQIVAAGRERALREHTYAHRIEQMLSIVYSSKFENLRAREEASPWKRVIERSKKEPELHARCLAAHQRGEEPNLDGLVSDIVSGKGKLSETEQKLLFLFHVRKQIIRMKEEEMGVK
jgi:spore maturation protein CgeB